MIPRNGKPAVDVDPAADAVEPDDDQSLPELETAETAPAGNPLADGRAAIARELKLAPTSPGVYRMLDVAGDVLYVGKANNIRKRLASYVRPTGQDTRIERMVASTRALEFVTTATETEALLLEANLIKRLRPRFNVQLRDDKSFPFILIATDHWAPRILKHRGAHSQPGQYYGPFASAGAVNRTINAIQRTFLLRSCTDPFFESRTRPCLLYQIKRCSAPCTREIEFADYAELVREANLFLSGKSATLKQELAGHMERASEALDFERAALLRDRLAALAAIQAHQGINPRGIEEADVFAVHQDGGFTCIEAFFFRTGQNWGNRAYFPKADRSLGAGEVLGAFLAQFYDDKPVPRLILLSHAIEEPALLAEALSTKAGRKVEVAVPQRGVRKELTDHALTNAREALARKLADTSSQRSLLESLAKTLELPRVPRRIEVYDNSHIQGTNAVGAMVVAGPEGFQKNQYRKFNIRSADLAPGDDYGMMREVLERRFKRLLAEAPRQRTVAADSTGGTNVPHIQVTSPLEGEVDPAQPGREGGERQALAQMTTPLPIPPPQGGREQHAAREAQTLDDEEGESPWPDLLLIDGGAGQLNAAVTVLGELGITDLPVVGIAKGVDRDAGRETFFVAGRDPIKLKPRDPVLYFVQRLRDEAHRFAVGSHRQRRRRDLREAGLQEIPGVGPTRKRALLRYFGTLKAVERASVADLAKVPGVSAEIARKIYNFFHEHAG